MKFRSYQIFYVLSAVLLTAALCVAPVMQLIEPNGATYLLENFRLVQPDATVSYVVCALGVVLSFGILTNLFGLFVSLFSNFELQKRTAILSMLLMAGYYILLLLCVLILMEDSSLVPNVTILFPFIALILNALSFMAARRTEAKILAKVSGFRLRN